MRPSSVWEFSASVFLESSSDPPMTHLHSWIQRVVLTGPARPPACEPPAHPRPAVCVLRSMVTGLNVTFGRLKSCWQRRDLCRQEARSAKPPAASCGPHPRPYARVGSSFLGVTGLLACHRWLWMVIASTLADNVLAGMWLNCFLSELYL